VQELGGIAAISASHPHMYGAMIEWSEAFGGAPVYVPEADKEWVTRPDPAVRFWSDQEKVLPEVTLVQCGGHFRGSATAYWSAGAEGRGLMLAGDTRDGGAGSRLGLVHAQLPELHSAVGEGGTADFRATATVRVSIGFTTTSTAWQKTGAREAVARLGRTLRKMGKRRNGPPHLTRRPPA